MGPKCSEKFAELLDRTSNSFEHLILAKNRTSNLPNITKNRTVREHRTVRSKTRLQVYQRDFSTSSPITYGLSIHFHKQQNSICNDKKTYKKRSAYFIDSLSFALKKLYEYTQPFTILLKIHFTPRRKCSYIICFNNLEIKFTYIFVI